MQNLYEKCAKWIKCNCASQKGKDFDQVTDFKSNFQQNKHELQIDPVKKNHLLPKFGTLSEKGTPVFIAL